jgi:hypothetical protein
MGAKGSPMSVSSRPLRNEARVAVLLVSMVAVVTPALAQEACKPTTLKSPALKLEEIYRIAEGHAKAWKSDVVPARISNTTMGPLKPDGSAEAWVVNFFSPSVNAHVSITTFRGTLTCYAQAGGAGRVPDLKPGFVLDGAKLYAIAKQHGEQAVAGGYAVMLGTAAAPSDRHATWNINFSKEGAKDAPLSIIVDANTGKVESVQRR